MLNLSLKRKKPVAVKDDFLVALITGYQGSGQNLLCHIS